MVHCFLLHTLYIDWGYTSTGETQSTGDTNFSRSSAWSTVSYYTHFISTGDTHQLGIHTASLTRQAAAAVSVGTYWPWERTATLRSALRRRGPLGGARRFGAYGGRRGPGAYCGGLPLQLVSISVYGENMYILCRSLF